MAMTNPTILQLLDKVDCRYTLVVEVSKDVYKRQGQGGARVADSCDHVYQ